MKLALYCSFGLGLLYIWRDSLMTAITMDGLALKSPSVNTDTLPK